MSEAVRDYSKKLKLNTNRNSRIVYVKVKRRKKKKKLNQEALPLYFWCWKVQFNMDIRFYSNFVFLFFFFSYFISYIENWIKFHVSDMNIRRALKNFFSRITKLRWRIEKMRSRVIDQLKNKLNLIATTKNFLFSGFLFELYFF